MIAQPRGNATQVRSGWATWSASDAQQVSASDVIDATHIVTSAVCVRIWAGRPTRIRAQTGVGDANATR